MERQLQRDLPTRGDYERLLGFLLFQYPGEMPPVRSRLNGMLFPRRVEAITAHVIDPRQDGLCVEASELICDGYHVHPAMSRVAINAKGVHGVMAITDGTAGCGLPPGSTARLGGQSIRVSDAAAVLDDGTLAGSTLTMDRAFRNIVTMFDASITDAAIMCATTPARALGLTGFGVIAEGNVADLVVLDRAFRVSRTFVNGEEIYRAG